MLYIQKAQLFINGIEIYEKRIALHTVLSASFQASIVSAHYTTLRLQSMASELIFRLAHVLLWHSSVRRSLWHTRRMIHMQRLQPFLAFTSSRSYITEDRQGAFGFCGAEDNGGCFALVILSAPSSLLTVANIYEDLTAPKASKLTWLMRLIVSTSSACNFDVP